jgi:hypothetical protein
MSTAEGAYCCAECKSWRHLMSWAAALVEGPLDAKGDLAGYTYVEDCYLHEDSIHCTKHMDAPIEKFRNGRWCRWWSCPKCQGCGRVSAGGGPASSSERSYECPKGLKGSEDRWAGRIHKGWLPASEHATLVAAEAAAS